VGARGEGSDRTSFKSQQRPPKPTPVLPENFKAPVANVVIALIAPRHLRPPKLSPFSHSSELPMVSFVPRGCSRLARGGGSSISDPSRNPRAKSPLEKGKLSAGCGREHARARGRRAVQSTARRPRCFIAKKKPRMRDIAAGQEGLRYDSKRED